MADHLEELLPEASRLTGSSSRFSIFGGFSRRFALTSVPFTVSLPDGTTERFGQAPPSFHVTLRNGRALRAIASVDEGRIGDAYVAGDIEIDGDMLRPFELRSSMKDFHLLTSAWRFVQPLILGQLRTNQLAITAHYDIDPEFFLSFLDQNTPCYTQGVYEHAHESLNAATLRKFDYCYEKCQLKPGDQLLEIGPGWGAWLDYASQRGVMCTGITISRTSLEYLKRRARELRRSWELVYSDLLDYQTNRRYDAIVIMGVIEHLPQYQRVLSKFMDLLKPGGRIFLDGSACTKKYELSSYMSKYIYGGNHSFLVLHDFLEKLASTPLRLLELFNDRNSYFLTFQQWARNFDRNRDSVIGRFGEFDYRRFRLYLWGAAYEFLSRSLDCYRMVLELPDQ